MRTNATEFHWSRRTERAALLVAQDEISDVAIAKQLKVHPATLERWKKRPDFAARVAEHHRLWREQIQAKGIAERQNRVDALNDRWDRMRRVIDARAQSLTEEVAGGDTGLLVRQTKIIGTGQNAQMIEEYQVDTGLLKELREHEKQAAQELGQWTEKRELTGKDGGPLEVVDAREELARRLDQLATRLTPPEAPGRSDPGAS